MEKQQSVSSTEAANKFYNTLSALEIRLDNTPIYAQVKNFLEGKEEVLVVDRHTNQPKIMKSPTGEPLANKQGIQAIGGMVKSTVNNQVVQGNYTKLQYEQAAFDVHNSVWEQICTYCYSWGIVWINDKGEVRGEENLNLIIDFIMNLIYPFLTRLIDNKERESYSDTIRTVEQNLLKEKGGGFTWQK